MGANGYFGDVWLEKISDDLAQNNVTSKKSDIKAEYAMKNSTTKISRDSIGCIDYKYYTTRSRTLRSDTVISFFKVVMTRLKF